MTGEEIQRRKEELRAIISVPEVLERYGVEIKRGRCRGICHEGKDLNAKITRDYLWCYVCNSSMDIFSITQHFEKCDFWTAFELLGGTEKPSFTATVMAQKARKERELKAAREYHERQELREIQRYITAYRNIIAEEDPFSDLWCYCHNKLQYQIYLLELHDEKR